MGSNKKFFDAEGNYNLFANGLEDKWVSGPKRWVYEVFMKAGYKSIPIDCDLGAKGYACNMHRIISDKAREIFQTIAKELDIDIYFNKAGNKIIIPRQN